MKKRTCPSATIAFRFTGHDIKAAIRSWSTGTLLSACTQLVAHIGNHRSHKGCAMHDIYEAALEELFYRKSVALTQSAQAYEHSIGMLD